MSNCIFHWIHFIKLMLFETRESLVYGMKPQSIERYIHFILRKFIQVEI